MPLTALACTVLDQAAAASRAADPAGERRGREERQVLKFLPTDTVCYRADPVEDRALRRRQEEAWGELWEWIGRWSAGHGGPPATAVGTEEAVSLSIGRGKQRGLPHPESLVEFCTDWVSKLDAWHLAVLRNVATEAKSFWVGAGALVGPLGTEAALRAARVEEEFQIEQWGLVEGGHDYDRSNAAVQVRAAILLSQCLALDHGWMI
jgi:ATP synthase F1 complex assembly factor 2